MPIKMRIIILILVRHYPKTLNYNYNYTGEIFEVLCFESIFPEFRRLLYLFCHEFASKSRP